MSDFLFSYGRLPSGQLTKALQSTYLENPVPIAEFHGHWGSLGVSPSPYTGFAPFDTETHLCVVVGGPVLYFCDNAFLTGDDDQAGTRAILEHWLTGWADWSEDLSGPFVILVIDKAERRVTCITDLMMFLPVYCHQGKQRLAMGTHLDALSRACGLEEAFDEASLVDFILHHVVTYPYTAYRHIQQCHPATEYEYQLRDDGVYDVSPLPYWLPKETQDYSRPGEAAASLRKGVEGYVARVTASMHHVAQFISGGEDSRVIAAMLPKRLERDAFMFLNSMNREGRIAEKVAAASGLQFHLDCREPLHYLDIMPEASLLIGSGHQYIHAHALGFHRRHGLADYEAVFGGYLADSLLKSRYARRVPGSDFLVFLPQRVIPGETRTRPVKSELFPDDLLHEVTRRRREHFRKVSALRPHSAHEWFSLWPMTMRIAISNLYSNRRLFRSYEVFTCKEAVKVSAATPTAWKLNRRLFLTAFRPYLKATWLLLHADGRLPYLPWWANLPIQTTLWGARQFARRTGLQKSYQGSWADWKTVMASEQWKRLCESLTSESVHLPSLRSALAAGALEGRGLSVLQRINLLQTCYLISGAHRRRPDDASAWATAASL
jgi:hypothetical protein